MQMNFYRMAGYTPSMNRPVWILSWILIAIGAVFYFAWAFLYDAWTDIGLYSITSVLLAFGILGAILAKLQ